VSEQLYGPIIGICGTLLFGWLLISGFRRGEMEWPYYGLTLSGRRKDQRVRFWTVTGCLTLFTAMLFFGTLLAILFPHGF
jgi:hypothetical protein